MGVEPITCRLRIASIGFRSQRSCLSEIGGAQNHHRPQLKKLAVKNADQLLTKIETNESLVLVSPSSRATHPTRLERVTYSSVDCRSIQLSYGCFLLSR